ncbi:MAG: diacylglycerol kinase family lipid kinase [Candidatus Tectomicrobia bacterium]|nr:diacylglycerol kinase family lipid kinase [Candidatus Tectomicrobia bacterium]
MRPPLPALNLAVIVNPRSGAGKGRRLAARLSAWLKQQGIVAPFALTEAPGHGRALAAGFLREGHRLLIVVGGDGTLHEVVNAMVAGSGGLANAAPPRQRHGVGSIAVSADEPPRPLLAILPCGKGNDFARALGIPTRWESWLAMLRAGSTRGVDLGWAGGRAFTTVAAVGFDAEVSERVNAARLRGAGSMLYLLMALRHLFRYQPKLLRLSGDFGVFEGRVFLTAVGNTPHYGGGMRITPGADPGDGVLEVCIVEPMPKLAVLRLLPSVYTGRHVSHPRVRCERTRTLRVESPEGPLWLHADGEPLCQTPAAIETLPRAVRLLVPAP